MKRRRLADLYVVGKEVSINDGKGEPVAIWVHKLNEVERESCVRRSNAAKARYLMDADQESSELYQGAWGQVREFAERDSLVAVIIADEVVKYRRRVEAELGEDDEGWAKDGYLQGLIDSWFGDPDTEGLIQVHIAHPEDPQVVRVLGELTRFNDEVQEQVKLEAERLEAEWETVPEPELWEKAAHRLLERRGEDIFVKEFERQQLFYAVREPDDHRKRYFGTLDEIDDLNEDIRTQILRAYNTLLVEPEQAKGLPATGGSSNSSESPDAEATSVPSGPDTANE